MNFTIKYNRTSVHIQGCAAATQAPGDGEDNGSGVVAYYAESACGSLTRNGFRMAVGDSFETAVEARDAAQRKAKALGLKFCKNCETAVKWSIANTPFDPEDDECECNGGDLCDCPDCDHPDCSYRCQTCKRRDCDTDHKNEEEARAAARRARNHTNYAPAPETTERKTRTLTFEYSATQGVIIAAALRKQAADEEMQANTHEQNGTGYEDQARTARNRAKMLLEAADEMHSTVQNALRQEDPMHKRLQDAIGLYW